MHQDTSSNDGPSGQDTTAMQDTAGCSRRSSRSRNRTHAVVDGNQASWMGVTMIEDDDLMFGGKPLCTWYEEDRRCSMGEDSELSPCSSTDGNDEELHRGRQRDRLQDRLQDQRTSHVQQHHKKKQEKLQH